MGALHLQAKHRLILLLSASVALDWYERGKGNDEDSKGGGGVCRYRRCLETRHGDARGACHVVHRRRR